MPPSRKSSVGNQRRAPQKYIPYRADDFQHGKKTGIAVAYVDHTDEFEPFEKVMSQADQRTPFRPKGTRRKRGPKTPVPVQEETDDDDENGEMSMELDDDTPVGPGAYFAHTRVNTITSSVQRVGSSSRPVAHYSDVNYETVPSPRASPTYTARRSSANKHGRPSVPSRLAHSMVASEEEESDFNTGPPNFDNGGYDDDDMPDDPPSPPPAPKEWRTPRSRRTSFANLEQEPEEEWHAGEDNMGLVRSPSVKARGKRRASAAQQDADEDIEPEIAQGLEDIQGQPMRDDEEPVNEQSREKKGKKGRDKAANSKSKETDGPTRGRPRAKREALREVTPDDPNADGLRRSKRRRYSPLAFWRLEKVVYGRRENGPCLVPSIKEIHRMPEVKAEPLAGRKKGYRRKDRRTATAEPQQVLVYDPEEGWDDETDPRCKVLDYDADGEEVERRVAFTAKMLKPKEASQGAFYFQKIFGDGDYLAAGVLHIPPNSTKPTKSTKDNTFVFFVAQGAVKFCVHQTNFILATGGMFMVPRGNVYYIQNISDRVAKLYFAQARKLPEYIVEDAESEPEEPEERPRSKSAGRRRRQSSSETINGDGPEPKQRRGSSNR